MSFTTLLLLFMVLVTVLLALIFLWKPGKKQQLPSLSQFIPQPMELISQSSRRDSELEEEIEIIAAMIREDEREKRRKAAIERLSELKAK